MLIHHYRPWSSFLIERCPVVVLVLITMLQITLVANCYEWNHKLDYIWNRNNTNLPEHYQPNLPNEAVWLFAGLELSRTNESRLNACPCSWLEAAFSTAFETSLGLFGCPGSSSVLRWQKTFKCILFLPLKRF